MRNWVIGALIGAFTMTVGGHVSALDSSTSTKTPNVTFGTCQTKSFLTQSGSAAVYLHPVENQYERYYPGNYWFNGANRDAVASG